MIRVVLPQHLRTLARVDREVMIEVHGRVTQRTRFWPCRSRPQYPMLRGTASAITSLRSADHFCGSSRVPRIFPMNYRTRRCPMRWRRETEPFLVVGAIAGG